MSWFQSGNLANLAKSALKEAQKTIDKALDINDESPNQSGVSTVKEVASDFFASWGVAVTSKYGDGDNAQDGIEENVSNKVPDCNIISSEEVIQLNGRSSMTRFLKQEHFASEDSASAATIEVLDVSSEDESLRKNLTNHNATTNISFPNEFNSTTNQAENVPTVKASSDDQFQSLWLTEEFEEEKSSTAGGLREVEENNVVASVQVVKLQPVKPRPLSAQSDYPALIHPEHTQNLPNLQPDDKKNSSVENLITISSIDTTEISSGEIIKQNVDSEQLHVIDLSSDTSEFPKEMSPTNVESFPEEFEVTNSTSSQGEWGWPSSDFADSVISADASTLTDSSTSENPLVISNSEADDKKVLPNEKCNVNDSQQPTLPPNNTIQTINVESEPENKSVQEEENVIEPSSVSNKSQSQSPQESVDTSENEHDHDDMDTSPKISSRATSSISVLSGASEKESPCPSSPALGGYGASSNSDSPSFEIISMHSSSSQNKRVGQHNQKQFSNDLILSNNGGEGIQVDSNVPSSCSSSIANVSFCNSNSAVENCSSFERIDPPSYVSPEPGDQNKKRSQHKKAASSSSSSDIEVIPLDSTNERKLSNCTPAREKVYSEVETQTDFPPEKLQKETVALPSKAVADIISEKDSEIQQLREEGEKLSKKQFELSNIIKKLRAKEKESESAAKNVRNELAARVAEVERLMKSFVVKEGVEQSQNETIAKLTSERRKLELLVEQLQSECEDAKENCASMKNSLENASIEILELKQIISSAHRDSAELDTLTREKSELVNRTECLQKEVEHLRTMVNATQTKASNREMELKTEVSNLTVKVHNLQDQLADVSSEVADATMPLSLEIEKLQKEIQTQRSQNEKRESVLQVKCFEMESKLKGAVEREKSLDVMQETYSKSVSSLETQLESVRTENKHLKSTLEETNHERNKSEQKLSHMAQLERRLMHMTAEAERLRNDNENLNSELKSERSLHDSERKKSQSLQDQLNRNQNHHVRNTSMSSTSTISNQNNKSGENSPSSQSLISEVSYLDEVFDPNGHNNRSMTPKSFFDSFSSANFIEALQSQLRLRETEVIQFQEEVAKNEKIRKTLNDEIANLTVKNQELLMRLENMTDLQTRMEEVEKNYNAVLQMYGEKVEESEELRLDLQDVKEMYKVQIEQLLKK